MKYKLFREQNANGNKVFIRRTDGINVYYWVGILNGSTGWKSKEWVLQNKNDIVNITVSGNAIYHKKLTIESKNAGLKENVRNWYIETYPTDDLGAEINPNITFKDILNALNIGKDVYEVIGFGDSLVRETIFSRLSEILNVTYDKIYEVWLEN